MLTDVVEPISPQTSQTTQGSVKTEQGSKSTTEKIKEKVKEPFVKDKQAERVKSPELAAAEEVLEGKGMI